MISRDRPIIARHSMLGKQMDRRASPIAGVAATIGRSRPWP
jgi:hypothetical protein